MSFSKAILSAGVATFFFFNDTATTEIYTLSLHDALPISMEEEGIPVAEYEQLAKQFKPKPQAARGLGLNCLRSEEHTSELQSPCNLVCRLLLEKKKNRHSILRKSYVNS